MGTQTREQAVKAVLDWNKASPDAKVPVPEIIRPGDVAHIDSSGNKVLVRDADVNSTDIRDVDAEGNPTSGWRKANA